MSPSKHPSDRNNRAIKEGWGAQQNMMLEYQFIGEAPVRGELQIYFPVAKPGIQRIEDDTLQAAKLRGKATIRQVFCAVAELLEDVEGMAKFVYDIEDEDDV